MNHKHPNAIPTFSIGMSTDRNMMMIDPTSRMIETILLAPSWAIRPC